VLGAVAAQAQTDGGSYRALGYAYLSPEPGSQYAPNQTTLFLMRFMTLPPTAVTNLAECIRVTGASSGFHPGTTKIASDNQTVIFNALSGFDQNELVTVSLAPQVDLSTNTAIAPYQYQFMINGALTNTGTITARGDHPPNATKAMAFDDNFSTEWQDLIVPNGSANSSWIQYVYPGSAMHVVNCYALTSANDNPAGDPGSWQLYGVDAGANLHLLDTESNQSFSYRLQPKAYAFTNTTAYRGYRLLITRVNNPAAATSVQLAELELIPATGSLLWECWLGIPGSAVSNLTSNAAYPGYPSLSDPLPSFNGPVNWAQNYGARVRGYITAPNTGAYQFWIASDDNSELWFSTNASPANARLIASVPGFTSAQAWTVYASQQSTPFNLQAGQQYYIEARHKQGGGGDNLAVGWAMPGQSLSAPSEVIPGEVLSPAPPLAVAPEIVVQPQSVSAVAGATAQISATVLGPLPLAYQWQLNSVNLLNDASFSGVNSNILTILNVAQADAGSYRLIVTNSFGSATSSNAVLSIETPSLVGEWLGGAANLADVSGYSAPGTHDGYIVGASHYRFTNDVPSGKTGQSLVFYNGDTGLAISNSSTLDARYVNTFDNPINNAFSVTCWAKGFPGQWSPWVSKFGETEAGWQLRDDGSVSNGQTYSCFTVRNGGVGANSLGTDVYGNPDDMATRSIASDDGNWHLYAGIFSAATGLRSLYVDGVLAAQETGNAAYTLAAAEHLCIGAKDSPPGNSFGNESIFEIYDVRVYNYDLSSTQVQPLAAITQAPSSSPRPALSAITSRGVPASPQPTAPPLTTTPKATAQTSFAGIVPGQDGIMPNGVSVPTDFPYINITTSNNPDAQYIFIDNRGGNGDPWNVIFDNSGQPVWYSKYPDERRDMKVQHNGVMTMLARDEGGDHYNGFNTNYQQIAQYWTSNGFTGDEHELQVLADGTYFMTALDTETVDMSRYIAGGQTNASVTESAIQEFTPEGDLILQWRAWDHVNILDEQAFIDLTSSSLDFTHMNAIDVDTDGNILLSSRNTSEITKIDRKTGLVIWRLGGVESDFTFPNDPLNGPANQHAVRMVTTNDYTLFDDGNLHNPSVSRGVEYVVDTNKMTATVIWQYPPVPTTSIYAYYMGNTQRLTNGNTLIDWAVGPLPKLTEVRPDGTKAFEMNWVNQYEAYRTWRCSWQAVALQPYLLLESYPDNVTLLFNQFGDTNIAYYRIYGGTTSHSTNVLATATVTLARLPFLQNGATYYFRVTAVHRDGTEGEFSNEQSVTVNLIQPGQNMVTNGNFSQGTNGWLFSLANSGSAGWAVANGVITCFITNAGTYATDIQMYQTGFRLLQGLQYTLTFDAWSTRPRYIQAEVGEATSPYLNYSGFGATSLTPVHNQYQYTFTMQKTSDFNANLMFDLGASTADVSLSNVSLSIAPPTTATALGWVQPPSTSVAGNAISPGIQVGASNEAYAVVGLPITLYLSSGIGALAGIQTANTDSNGVAHFSNLSVSQAGLKQLMASNAWLTITSAVFTVLPPPLTANALSWAQQPSSAMAGAVISPEIQVAAWTNATPVANVLLTLSLTNGAGALAGTLATNTDSNGIAHFPNLSIDAAGLKQLAVGDASTTLVTNSANFTISPLSANKLVIAQQPPGTATAGVVMTPALVVQVTDQYGNVIPGATDAISAVQAPGTGGYLNAGAASEVVTASNGVAAFSSLYVTNAATNVTLIFSDPNLPIPSVMSRAINVIPNTAAALNVTQQPSRTATVGAAFAQQPILTILDGYGNIQTGYTNAVTAAEADGGNLNAGLAAPAATPTGGVAAFTGLFVTNASLAVTLAFTSGSLPPIKSTAINVSAGPASQLVWTTQPGNAVAGLPFGIQPVLQTADSFGNASTNGLLATQNVEVSLTAGAGPLLGTVNYNIGFSGGNGVVAFTNLLLAVPGVGYVLTASNTTPTRFTPPLTNQLGLWLDASDLNTLTITGGGNVIAWDDKSGDGRTAVPGIAPMFATNSTLASGAEGQARTVRFDGTSNYLNVDLTFLNETPYSIAVIEVASNKGGNTSYFLGDTGKGGDATDNALHTGYRSSGDFTFAHYGDDLDYVPGSFPYPEVRVWTDTIDSNKLKTIYLNGMALEAGTATGFLNAAGCQGHVGSGFDTSSSCFQGDVAEILVYSNNLSATQVGSVMNYFSNKWLCASCAPPGLLANAVSSPFTVLAATAPPQKILEATVTGGGSFVLTYATTAGFQYQVQFTTNLAAGSWVTLPASATNAAGTPVIFSDTNAPGSTQRFYRIVSP